MYVAREEISSHMGMGFKWKPSPRLRKPCLFLHLWILVLLVWVQDKILLSNITGRSISGLAGKKIRPILLKSYCLHIKLKSFAPLWLFVSCVYRKSQRGRALWEQINSPQDRKKHLAC